MPFAITAFLVAFYFFYIGSITNGSAQSKDYEIAILLAVVSSIVLSMSSIAFRIGQVAMTNIDVAPKVITTIV